MTDRYWIKETREMVFIGPDGMMRFYGEKGLQSSAPITFDGFTTAVKFAIDKGWEPLTIAGVPV